jgi:hypothetical protein
MDLEVIDQALHEIQQMVEVSIRATESLQGVNHDPAPWTVSQMPRADHELLDFSLIDLARRVEAARAMLFESDRARCCQAGALDRARLDLKN